MSVNKITNLLKGTSGDSFFLILVRIVTLVVGMFVTRVLSGHFSLQEYGTYSQILLLTTTISSMTTLGMMDGINFFFCKEKIEEKRNAYVSTIFFLQYLIGIIVSLIVVICAVPISKYFGNDNLKSLIIFAAVMPILSNSISLLQIMFVAIGKAKVIGIRNLIVSVLKFIAMVFACYVFDSIVIVLIFQVITDAIQVLYFYITLGNRNCKINIFRFDKTLIKEILIYCIPMAMFSVIKSLNRDSDKFVVSFFTNTETLAVYTNASKLLPFDIIMTSFCTVLLPYITRYIANREYKKTEKLYRSFLELSYISTSILAIGAICVAPELMRFLYTEKYASYDYGIIVFIIYTVVDMLSVLNITMILSAAGKTKTILFSSIGTFIGNIILNIFLFHLMGISGPATATLIVTFVQGIIILSLGAKTIQANITRLINLRSLLTFIVQSLAFFILSFLLRKILLQMNIHYFVVLVIVYLFFCGAMFLCNFRKIVKNLRIINKCKMKL